MTTNDDHEGFETDAAFIADWQAWAEREEVRKGVPGNYGNIMKIDARGFQGVKVNQIIVMQKSPKGSSPE